MQHHHPENPNLHAVGGSKDPAGVNKGSSTAVAEGCIRAHGTDLK